MLAECIGVRIHSPLHIVLHEDQVGGPFWGYHFSAVVIHQFILRTMIIGKGALLVNKIKLYLTNFEVILRYPSPALP